jgi:hypothetical protein
VICCAVLRLAIDLDGDQTSRVAVSTAEYGILWKATWSASSALFSTEITAVPRSSAASEARPGKVYPFLPPDGRNWAGPHRQGCLSY